MSESEQAEEEELFEVEKIVDTKVLGKKRYYFLKWKGYDHSQNTWELAENLNCDELIAEFNKKLEVIETMESKPGNGAQIPIKIISDSQKNGVKLYKVEYPNKDMIEITSKKLIKSNPFLLIDYLLLKQIAKQKPKE